MVTVVAKDILKLADDDRAQCPKPNRSKLFSDIDSMQTSLTLTPSGIGNQEYPANGIIRIGSEIMTFTRAADVLTIVRNQYNSVAAEHKANDAVQLCAVFTAEPVQNIIYQLLTAYANLPITYISKTAWDLEQSSYLPGVYSAIITEPTGVNKLIAELTEQGLCYLWWDEVAKLVQFRALRPPQNNLPLYSDENGFIADSLSLKELSNERISRFLVYFDRKDLTKKLDEAANYNQYVLGADLESESPNEHGSSRIKTIFSRWFNANSLGRVEILAQTLLKKYTNPPRVLEFIIDNKEDLAMGDLFIAQTRLIQNDVGDDDLVNMQVVERIEQKAAHHIKIKAQENIYNTRANDFNNRKVIISFDTLDLNLYDAYVDEYGVPPSDVLIEFEVLAGVLVSASTTTNYALTVDDRWPSGVTIILINNGLIAGRGGKGADAPWHYSALNSSPIPDGQNFIHGQNGENGGNAIFVEHAILIINNGVIAAGGGGGGNSVSMVLGDDLTSEYSGAGGGGAPIGLGGARAYIQQYVNGIEYYLTDSNNETAGKTATKTIGGQGGVKFSKSVISPFGYTEDGAKGGDLAQNGQNGKIGQYFIDNPIPSISAGLGGQAGDAIHGNSLIAWQNLGTILGTVI